MLVTDNMLSLNTTTQFIYGLIQIVTEYIALYDVYLVTVYKEFFPSTTMQDNWLTGNTTQVR